MESQQLETIGRISQSIVFFILQNYNAVAIDPTLARKLWKVWDKLSDFQYWRILSGFQYWVHFLLLADLDVQIQINNLCDVGLKNEMLLDCTTLQFKTSQNHMTYLLQQGLTVYFLSSGGKFHTYSCSCCSFVVSALL